MFATATDPDMVNDFDPPAATIEPERVSSRRTGLIAMNNPSPDDDAEDPVK